VNPQNIYLVEKLADILSLPPFTTNQPIHTFCDLDGVALSFSSKEGVNFPSLLALARIAKASQELTLWSLRLKVGDNFLPALFDQKSLSYFPVINDRSLTRLRSFFSKVAPETETYFDFGLGKLAKEGLFPKVDQVLTNPDQEAVLIGSSIFDRLEMGKLLGKLSKEKRGRLWYFDTGKIIF
ncbi:MAG: hypothetical protein XD98_0513, partial [Microgenomates bacterium 39_6]